MYYPILRGKQFELIALRELSPTLSAQTFKPIIEPVRRATNPLLRTISVLNENNIQPIIIVNPFVGDFSADNSQLLTFLAEQDIEYTPCVNLSKEDHSDHLLSTYRAEGIDYAVNLVGGIDQPLINHVAGATCTIIDSNTSPLAMSQLGNVVLVGDFFDKKTRNADYPRESVFSHLHVTALQASNVIGFGDYTLLPQEFIEGGGPAYVVTIHASYIDPERFNEMYVRHYSSYDDKTPTDPARKFSSALNELISDVEIIPNIFTMTAGIDEFVELHESGHFPGLGSVKRISIKHHIETICEFLG